MKQIVSMSRLTNQLEKMFRLLNQDFFNNELETPIITVVPSSRSYAHYTPWSAWQSKDTYRREINIASGTLDRPLEAVTASLLHEMVHMYNDLVLNIQDCSRGGTYHSKIFKEQAEAHGLLCFRTEKYGWSRTTPSDMLLEWLLLHDELREIEMCRVNPGCTAVGIGTHTGCFFYIRLVVAVRTLNNTIFVQVGVVIVGVVTSGTPDYCHLMYLSISWSHFVNDVLFAYVVVMLVWVIIRIARPIAENAGLFLVVTASVTYLTFPAAATTAKAKQHKHNKCN